MFTQRSVLALTICTALLLPTPSVSLLSVNAAQNEGRRARPRHAQPEGVLPDLEELKSESQIEREAPAPIPSTIPSRKSSGKPWDGRRVGDPPPRDLAQVKRTRHFAHAARRAASPPTVLDSYFVDNLFDVAVLRDATNAETNYWHDLLRVAHAEGSLKLAAVELGRTLFESAEYLTRDRNAHWYVYDLYKTYLMREPDSGGWATWEALELAGGAAQAGYARQSTGATFNDVYFSGVISEGVILHEALHTLLGANDSDLNARQADLGSLRDAGCNVQGRALP